MSFWYGSSSGEGETCGRVSLRSSWGSGCGLGAASVEVKRKDVVAKKVESFMMRWWGCMSNILPESSWNDQDTLFPGQRSRVKK